MKKDVYVCEVCEDSATCFSLVQKACAAPDDCQYQDENNSNWQKTTEYKIVRCPGPPVKERKIDIVLDFPPTPNCSVCEWQDEPFDCNIKSFDELNKVITESAICKAQGRKTIVNVWNSPECKKLFSAQVK